MFKFNVKLINNGSSIKVFQNNDLVLSCNDSEFSQGYYGIYHLSNESPKFHSYNVLYSKPKNFQDILSQMNWEETSVKLVNTINSKEDKTIAKPEIISSALNNNINYVMWSRFKNILFNLDFINNIDNNGVAIFYKKE